MQNYTHIKLVLSDPAKIADVIRILKTEKFTGITGFTNYICEHFGFRTPNGINQTSTVNAALRNLEDQGVLSLPWPKTEKTHSYRISEEPPVACKEPEVIDGKCQISIVLINNNREDLEKYNTILKKEFPEAKIELIGRVFRYFVKSGDKIVGLLGFSSADLHSSHRDSCLSLKKADAEAALPYFVNLRHIFMRKGWETYLKEALELCIPQIIEDFKKNYGSDLLLVETAVDNESPVLDVLYEQKWQLCSSGKVFKPYMKKRRRKKKGDNINKKKDYKNGKSVFVFFNHISYENFIKFCNGSIEELIKSNQESINDYISDGWAEKECEDANFDKRLVARFVKILTEKANAPSQPLYKLFNGNSAAIQGLYHFLEGKIKFDSIMESHYKHTVERSSHEKIRLWASDGSDINFNGLKSCCKDLGDIGENSKGLSLQATLCLSIERLILGLGYASIRAKEYNKSDEKEDSSQIDIRDKNSFDWIEHLGAVDDISRKYPEITDVFITDRGGDFFELLETWKRLYSATQLLIRAKGEHSAIQNETKVKIDKILKSTQLSGKMDIEHEIENKKNGNNRNGNKNNKTPRKRRATLEIKYTTVKLAPPVNMRELDPVEINVIQARENKPPKGVQRVEWLLFTTLPINSVTDAIKYVKWYQARWRIEEFFRMLKTGCCVEKMELRSAERLKKGIAISLIVSARCMTMLLLAREVPNLPAEIMFNEIEVTMLKGIARANNLSEPTTLGAAVFIVCTQGGYIGRKNDPQAGFQAFRSGYEKLKIGVYYLKMYDLGKSVSST